jgi:hypothetical protein
MGSICEEWMNMPQKNPRTHRSIKLNGPMYLKLLKECGEKPLTICEQWLDRPLTNPRTNKTIKENGPTYLKLLRECEHKFEMNESNETTKAKSNETTKAQTKKKHAFDESNIEKIIQDLVKTCRTNPTFSKYVKINIKIIKFMKRMHDSWVSGKDDHALLKANYLMDYYCSTIVRMCDRCLTPKDCKMVWATGEVTYDVFNKEHIAYSEGIKQSIDLVNGIATDVLNWAILKSMALVNIVKKGKVDDWEMFLNKITLRELLNRIQLGIDSIEKYDAAGWGMYRLMNKTVLQDGSETTPLTDKKSCSCICKSLLYILVLKSLGYPNEFLFTHPQANSEFYNNKRMKLTHWSVACKHPYANIIELKNNIKNVLSLENKNISSTKGFALYTRDIIWYYLLANKWYKKEKIVSQNVRALVLDNLISEYDNAFPNVNLKTPKKQS